MKRAAIYARFSTDLQNERSIEDQIALCEKYAARENLEVVARYSDAARSGASLLDRDGADAMIRDAYDLKFDVLVVEALDRISRDMEDMAGIYKRFTHRNIQIVAVHEGKANTINVGIRSIVNQLYREDNAHKVRRGLSGLIKQGKSAGGRSYGYKLNLANKGIRHIDEDEAAVVLRIFERLAEGVSPRMIAKELNRDKVPSPRGGLWNASTIGGDRVRGLGVLHNQLYIGKLVWNKVRKVKDPDTGKRSWRANPQAEWETTEVPDLRIVPQELWDKAHELNGPMVRHVNTYRRPKRLLSGLLKCGCCGSGMAISGKDRSGKYRVRCGAHAENGSCPDPHTFYISTIEELVVDELLRELREPKRVTEFIRTYHERREENNKKRERRRRDIERRIAHIFKESDRLLGQNVRDEVPMALITPKLKALEKELLALQDEQNLIPPPAKIVTLHPASLKVYEMQLAGMRDALLNRGTHETSHAARALRQLVTKVTVHKDPSAQHGMRLVVEGTLNALLGVEGEPPKVEISGKSMVKGMLVPAVGFEPTTP